MNCPNEVQKSLNILISYLSKALRVHLVRSLIGLDRYLGGHAEVMGRIKYRRQEWDDGGLWLPFPRYCIGYRGEKQVIQLNQQYPHRPRTLSLYFPRKIMGLRKCTTVGNWYHRLS